MNRGKNFFFEICRQYEHAPSKSSLALDWANGWSPKDQFSLGQQIFLFSKSPWHTPKHTQSPIPSVPEAFVLGLKQAVREADRSAPYNVDCPRGVDLNLLAQELFF